MPRSTSAATRVALSVTGLLAIGTVTACANNDHAATPALASTSVGSLSIADGYIPEPASPDVAAAYLTITNKGDTPEELEQVTSSAAPMVMPMDETDANGVGTMTDLHDVTIPAHGSMRFTPDHAHLMLEQPKTLKAGDHVTLTLTFSHAGTVKMDLPVVPLGQAPTSVPTQMTMVPGHGSGSMPGMSGMTMP